MNPNHYQGVTRSVLDGGDIAYSVTARAHGPQPRTNADTTYARETNDNPKTVPTRRRRPLNYPGAARQIAWW
jgi:hypothetical protein